MRLQAHLSQREVAQGAIVESARSASSTMTGPCGAVTAARSRFEKVLAFLFGSRLREQLLKLVNKEENFCVLAWEQSKEGKPREPAPPSSSSVSLRSIDGRPACVSQHRPQALSASLRAGRVAASLCKPRISLSSSLMPERLLPGKCSESAKARTSRGCCPGTIGLR